MLSLSRRIAIFYQHSRVRSSALLACASLAVFAAPVFAAQPVPQNLGNGLDKIVASNVAVAGLKGAALQAAAPYQGFVTEQAQSMDALAIKDANGRYLVRVNPSPNKSAAALTSSLPSQIASLEVTAVDNSYRHVGVFNAWVAPADVAALANSTGVRSVILELQPRHAHSSTPNNAQAAAPEPGAVIGGTYKRLGTTFDQGVFQHGIDKINQYYNPAATADWEGQGMSIGFISNSYNAHTTSVQTGLPDPHPASIDVTNFDLPGDPSNPVNTQPVVVLQDDLSDGTSDDEGRGMIQIGYKMAPKAQLAFATANTGEVGFANNIRSLAGIPANLYPGQTFAADTICDDVGYFDEPYFQDGIIGAGVNDAVAFGVSYFSSAANDIGTNGYDSELRWVGNGTGNTSATNTALVGSNINLATIPTGLYAGGFHNFNPVPGALDIAQTVNVIGQTNNSPTVLQWNDPYDQNTAPNFTATLLTAPGDIEDPSTSASQTFNVTASITAGSLIEVDSTANAGSTFDSIVTVKDPSGNVVIGPQDTGTDEIVRFFAPVTGTGYSVVVSHYAAAIGTYTVTVRTASGFTGNSISTDVNLLVFDMNGNYLPNSSLVSNNFATNEPIEIGVTPRLTGTTPAQTQVQYVIARANVAPNGGPTHVRYLIPGNGATGIGPAEYFTYNTVTTSGHAMAVGTNGMAAYSVFRPSLPEIFTSPGPVRIYFDANGNFMPLPEIRREPRLAAADAGNVSSNMNVYFVGDSGSDSDTNGNFSGTSAAGPHAAAIGALVLQAHGGHHSLTPTQMTTLLEHNTFSHDLDPSYASGFATTSSGETIRIVVGSDGSGTAGTGTGSQDANAISVSYIGAGNLTALKFNPDATAATGGHVTGGNNGYADVTPATTPPTVTYFENSYPGLSFLPAVKAFTVGSASSVLAASVTAVAYTNLAPLPSNGTNQWWTMGLTFDSSFTSGKVLRYTVARGPNHSSSVTGTVPGTGPTGGTQSSGYLGDLFGGGVSLPTGTINPNGMTFSGTTSTGTFSGVMRNRIGAGYSPVDGYGFINAAQAVGAPVQ
ncbi:hypothetical protein ELE36_04365 [Pseudolysobacter antarcticus]|uniref:Peptidase S8/S53 domain-containing protein n=1 Tax=Pseudolysobacter antarcticus TaxID=2511995 RepID=A0A411HGW7_9GAMM|nr:hypothetical protein [Pseudolysobacter antarcticus]QBB69670.1 hypothetical protein ELE36_04365 [Pseudolysobacter antarcticus]